MLKASIFHSNKAIATALITLMLVVVSAGVHALPEDSQQPIHITSNSAIRDEKTGLTIYKGKVNIKQGTLDIRADKVTIYMQNEEVTRIVAEGRPARLKQKPEKDQADVIAKATKIEYRLSKEVITLTKNAVLNQQGSTFSGEKINYDMNAERVEASSTEESGPISVVIPANSLSKKDKPEKGQPK